MKRKAIRSIGLGLVMTLPVGGSSLLREPEIAADIPGANAHLTVLQRNQLNKGYLDVMQHLDEKGSKVGPVQFDLLEGDDTYDCIQTRHTSRSATAQTCGKQIIISAGMVNTVLLDAAKEAAVDDPLKQDEIFAAGLFYAVAHEVGHELQSSEESLSGGYKMSSKVHEFQADCLAGGIVEAVHPKYLDPATKFISELPSDNYNFGTGEERAALFSAGAAGSDCSRNSVLEALGTYQAQAYNN